MYLARAIFWHFLVILSPTHFAYQWYYDPNRPSIGFLSTPWLTVGILFSIFWLTHVSIPCFTSPLRHLPALDGETFVFGHTLVVYDGITPDTLLQASYNTRNDGLLAFWQFFYLGIQLVITTPEAAIEVLNKHAYDYEKPALAKRVLALVLGDGMINNEGRIHKAMRRSVGPAFSQHNIRSLVPMFWSKGLSVADAMCYEAQTSVDGEVEVLNQMARATLDNISAAGTGMILNTVEHDHQNEKSRLAEIYAIITSPDRGPILTLFFLNVSLPSWFVKKLGGTMYARVAKATEELHEILRMILREKKKAVALDSDKFSQDIMATILRSGDFSDDYLFGQLFTFLSTGHDTVATALTFCLWLLSSHQDIQDRLRKECQDHLTGLNGEINADIFDRMPYLNAVCKESLRLYPNIPMSSRVSIVDTKIGNTNVPKGTLILISPWMLNRSRQIWGEDSDMFQPQRWIDGPSAATGNANSPYAFSSFLHGPHGCIGQNFSKQEMRCLLAALMTKFRVEPSTTQPHVELGVLIAIKPKNGLRLKLAKS